MQTQTGTTQRGSKLFDQILRFESGTLGDEELVPMFQALVDTGLAWQLQGSYGRMAHDMLEAGFIHTRDNS